MTTTPCNPGTTGSSSSFTVMVAPNGIMTLNMTDQGCGVDLSSNNKTITIDSNENVTYTLTFTPVDIGHQFQRLELVQGGGPGSFGTAFSTIGSGSGIANGESLFSENGAEILYGSFGENSIIITNKNAVPSSASNDVTIGLRFTMRVKGNYSVTSQDPQIKDLRMG